MTPDADLIAECRTLRNAAVAADERAEAAEKDAARLREALNAIMIEPCGCRFCHSGKLIKPNDPEKDHDDDCGFLLARAAIANEQEATCSD